MEKAKGRPPAKVCARRKWQGYMVYYEGPKTIYPVIKEFFDRYGIVFELEESTRCLEAVPTDRFFHKEFQFFLDAKTKGSDPEQIKFSIESFRKWIDKQGGIAPSGLESKQKSYEYGAVAAMEGNK